MLYRPLPALSTQLFSLPRPTIFRYSERPHLQIDVAKWSTGGVDNLTNSSGKTKDAHLKTISQLTITSWWHVQHVDGASNSVGGKTGLQVLVLPDPPGTIDLSVVKPENWVSWGDEEISSWVATNGVVASSVNTIEAPIEHDTVNDTLHVFLEVDNGVVLGDQVDGLFIGGEAGGEPLGNIATHAAWLVAEVVACNDTLCVESWSQRGKVDGKLALSKWTRLNTSTSLSWWNAVDASGKSISAVVLSEDTVSGHGVVGAVEQWGGQRVGGGFSPVPVWLSTLVVTLLDQGLLVVPGEKSVPCEEGGSDVDGEGLLDVDSNEVIVAGLGSWSDLWVELGWKLGQADDSVGVGLALRWEEGGPGMC